MVVFEVEMMGIKRICTVRFWFFILFYRMASVSHRTELMILYNNNH